MIAGNAAPSGGFLTQPLQRPTGIHELYRANTQHDFCFLKL
jgi:hypothetical protein